MPPKLRSGGGKHGGSGAYVSPYAQRSNTSNMADRSDVNKSLDAVCNMPVTFSQLNTALDERFDRFSNLFKESLNEIRENFNRIDNDICEIKKRVEQLEKNHNENCNDSLLLANSVCDEIADRNRRAKNIILHGLGNSENGEDDLTLFNNMLNEIPSMPQALSASRIGKSRDNLSRPIKITFASREEVITIFKNKQFFIQKNLKITNDQTLQERNYLNLLRNQLKLRVEAGDKNLTIKYINGSPKIIDCKKNA